jgi:hypothetical protein
VRAAYRVRQGVNAVNGSTLLGLALAKAYGARLQRGDDGLVLARGARDGLPRASAFTVGNVVILRVEPDEQLLRHEAAHATQWACCVVVFLPLYWAAAGWSWLRTGDHWSRNVFERRAGLVAGRYVEQPVRPLRRRRDVPH